MNCPTNLHKLHAIINSRGELLRLQLTAGNVDDRKPMPNLYQGLFGQLFADNGYINSGYPNKHQAQETANRLKFVRLLNGERVIVECVAMVVEQPMGDVA